MPEEETPSFITSIAFSIVSSGDIVTTEVIIISSTLVPNSYLSSIKLWPTSVAVIIPNNVVEYGLFPNVINNVIVYHSDSYFDN